MHHNICIKPKAKNIDLTIAIIMKKKRIKINRKVCRTIQNNKEETNIAKKERKKEKAVWLAHLC